MAKKIFLSPSNQTDNTYAYGNTTEAVQCGRIADAAKEALERCGFEVKINHLGKMAEKVAQSNAWPADLHIPIHTNAANQQVTGTRMFYYSEGSNSYKACKAIYDVLAPLTPGTSENIRAYPSLYEMNRTTATAVYIEVEFHDVSSAAKWIVEHPVEIGEAICKGVCNYYGVTYKEGSGTGTSTPAASTSSSTELYRVRKSWSDAKSQIGAYKSLDNAKKACKSGYKVYNSKGEEVYAAGENSAPAASSGFTEYKVQVKIKDLYIRKGPGTNYTTNGFIKPSIYTIVAESSGAGSYKGWGKLKSGAGWISLDYCYKL